MRDNRPLGSSRDFSPFTHGVSGGETARCSERFELVETADDDAINRYRVGRIYIIGAMYNH